MASGKRSWVSDHVAKLSSLGTDPGDFDPAFVERQLAVVHRLFGPGRYFDVDVAGWENLPEGGSMLVSNHSGGTTVLDGWGFMAAWYRHHGVHRPLHGLAHEMIFATRPTGRYFARAGVLRAGHDAAERVVKEYGRSFMVMPGGDQDVWRPARQRFQVNFDGRKGYARTALRLNTPVVPVAHVGAHHTLYVLTDGRAFARAAGIHKLVRAEVFPVHLSFPWGLAVGPWPHLPPPARLSYRLGAPISPADFAHLPEDAAVLALDAAVRASIQAMLDELAAATPPLRARLRDAVRRTARDTVPALTRGVVRRLPQRLADRLTPPLAAAAK